MKKVICGIVVGMAFVMLASACTTEKKPTKTIEYTVVCGDTLWDIAVEHIPSGLHLGEYIFDLKRNNGLETSDIYPGMVLEIETEVE